MKRSDIIFTTILVAAVILFLPLPFLNEFHESFIYNPDYWAITSFIKFALLSTIGESLGLRIRTGKYNYKGFGLLPRAIVWGFLGIGIKIAFVVFAAGSPILLSKYFGLHAAIDAMKLSDIFAATEAGLGMTRLITAFTISALMNLIFAPVFMTFHKITDTHIINNGGTLRGFFTPIAFGKIFPSINWFVQWDFVFKRTIPMFWIPAHTITFLLPEQYQIVFAAFLGIILGVLLAIAAQKQK
ncbi:MAG: Mpv17/PMP22 family protein [Bacteroidales bacterium]|nr:Mpv17/PMP22 family protein [Bacteroidales bacterium]